MIIIKKPYIIINNKHADLICNIEIDNKINQIYFRVNKEYEKYLCYERSDAYLIVLFYWAMRNNHDIICETPVSADLYYQICEYLMPILLEKGKKTLKPITIKCEVADNMPNESAVGTGITCGVDSFHAILNNINNKYKTRKLTHLMIMSLADSYKKNGQYDLITEELYNKSRKVAKYLELPLIEVKSNVRELFPIPPMHTLIRLFGVYSLQKLFGVYYWASGFPIWTFNIEDSISIDSARYDLLLCKTLTTKNLFIYSEGSSKTRMDKLKLISNYEIAKNNLHVCTETSTNCCKCKKCIRTMCALDCLGQLEKYNNVFDVDYYHNNIDYYFNEIIKMYNEKDIFIYEFIYDLAQKYQNNPIFQNFKIQKEICSNCYKLSDYYISQKNLER